MKKLPLIILIIFLSIASAYGQSNGDINPQNFEQKAEQEVGRMAISLQLTPVQKDSTVIATKWYYKQIGLLKNQNKTVSERGAYLQQYETEWKTTLSRILTVGQYGAYMEQRTATAQKIQHRIDSLRNSQQ